MAIRRRVSVLSERERGVVHRIRLAMEQNEDLTQVAVSEKLRVARPQVNKWYNGHEMPSAKNLIRLPEVLGVSAAWLLQGVGPMYGFPGQSADVLSAVKTELDRLEEAVRRVRRVADMAAVT